MRYKELRLNFRAHGYLSRPWLYNTDIVDVQYHLVIHLKVKWEILNGIALHLVLE